MGSAKACVWLGKLRHTGELAGVKKDLQKARTWYEKAAERFLADDGDATASFYNLGLVALALGGGEEAMRHFQKALEVGTQRPGGDIDSAAQAAWNLGAMQLGGYGGGNAAAAKPFLEQAAQLGLPRETLGSVCSSNELNGVRLSFC